MKISDIRARAEHVLVRRFDVRMFHDKLLADGAVPLDIVEDEMSRWVDAQERLYTRS